MKYLPGQSHDTKRSALVGHCLSLLVVVVDWCASRLQRLICCQIISTASSPLSALICRSLSIHLPDLSPFPSGRVRFGESCETWTLILWWHWPIGYVFLFLKWTADVLVSRFSVVFRRHHRLWSFSASCGDRPICHPNSERFTVLLCYQLQTNFYNTSFVCGAWASDVGSSRTIYGTHSTHQVCSSQRSGYLAVVHLCVCPIRCKVHWILNRRLYIGLCRFWLHRSLW